MSLEVSRHTDCPSDPATEIAGQARNDGIEVSRHTDCPSEPAGGIAGQARNDGIEVLRHIESPFDLRVLTLEELERLAEEIRARLIEVTSQNGGHLASSLGTVEITLALHLAFDFAHDRLVFDVGHQSYAHKLITGRNAEFGTLRTLGGVCGFPRRDESIFDAHDSGHASDSLSIATGLALARDLKGTDERIVVLIGDASLSGGMAFEALNQIGHEQTNMIIVLNDNEMSISRNVGALSLYLGELRMSKPYTTVRDTLQGGLRRFGRPGKALAQAGNVAKSSFKKLLVPGMFFEDMGIRYVGPIDGHNIGALSKVLHAAKSVPGPVLLHAVTQKGRGFAPAEEKPHVFHGVGAFDPSTGEANKKAQAAPSYTSLFAEALIAEAASDDSIIAVTAAMEDGTGLAEFKQVFPGRFVDVGIAEEHAVALAAGIALGGKKPVAAIYSTFLQRAYDQVMIDVAQQGLHVVFAVDRAGIVGEDGPTHQGVFDLAYLRTVPGMRILAPYSADDMRDCLHTALALSGGPVALRYPRGSAPSAPSGREPQILAQGKARLVRGSAAHSHAAAPSSDMLPDEAPPVQAPAAADVTFLAVGRMVKTALDAADLLAAQGFQAKVYNMLWVKPLDEDALADASASRVVVTLEDGTATGGFGSAVLEAFSLHPEWTGAHVPRILTLGLPDGFIAHGAADALFAQLGLSAEAVASRIEAVLPSKM